VWTASVVRLQRQLPAPSVAMPIVNVETSASVLQASASVLQASASVLQASASVLQGSATAEASVYADELLICRKTYTIVRVYLLL